MKKMTLLSLAVLAIVVAMFIWTNYENKQIARKAGDAYRAALERTSNIKRLPPPPRAFVNKSVPRIKWFRVTLENLEAGVSKRQCLDHTFSDDSLAALVRDSTAPILTTTLLKDGFQINDCNTLKIELAVSPYHRSMIEAAYSLDGSLTRMGSVTGCCPIWH